MKDPAAFPDPDSIERSVQSIQGVEQGFCLSLPAIAPQAFSHRVQRLDGVLDISSGRCFGLRFLWH